jgi:catechol 2,3-dioxygenase-like lactoylglutathione lyase family enzyme
MAPFKIVGIDHVVLRAADPAALERFYLDVLGLSLEMRQGKLAQLRAGHALIDIVPADDAGPAGSLSSNNGANLDHFCLRIEPFDVAAIAKHLAEQGIIFGPDSSSERFRRRLMRWSIPKPLVFQCRVFGEDPLPPELDRRHRPHHRIRRRGGRTSPNPNFGTGDGGQQAAPAGRSDRGSLG